MKKDGEVEDTRGGTEYEGKKEIVIQSSPDSPFAATDTSHKKEKEKRVIVAD